MKWTVAFLGLLALTGAALGETTHNRRSITGDDVQHGEFRSRRSGRSMEGSNSREAVLETSITGPPYLFPFLVQP